MYMVFQTQSDAISAESAISSAMGMPILDANGYTATRWAIPMTLTDGRWAFLRPVSLPTLTVSFVEIDNPDFLQADPQ